MAGLTRLELATFRVTGGRSNQTELQPLDNRREKIILNVNFIKKTRKLNICAETKKWLLGQDSNLRPND
jgi:hypothetical protein